ncbi:MAG: 50S ribosomal protein L13 [Bacteroidales bacterium]|nr:50S ribosomal protein L13 [Bacteroidales bacterium]MEE3448627.1 50S ribosomal protein L13 [Bacteroidales bacterium]
MDSLSFKTVSLNKETAQKEWLLVDATDQTLGRFASKVAMLLRGKYKASFTPHVDCGDNVIVINADKIRLTGKKWAQKEYVHHSLYPGGQKIEIAKDFAKKVDGYERIIRKAVRGMLPKNKLADAILSNNLKVYQGAEHNHEAQKPRLINVNELR